MMVATHQTVNTCFEYLQDISLISQLARFIRGAKPANINIEKSAAFNILSCQSLGDI